MNGIERLEPDIFDHSGFWQQINPILKQGTKDMLLSTRDKEALVAAYDKMDREVNDVVENFSPPKEILGQLMNKLKDRVRVVGRIMKANNIDPSGYWETETIGVSRIILRAIGADERDLFRVDRVKQQAIEALMSGNFSRGGAERFLDHLGTFDCKDLKSMMSTMQDRPSHIDFLSFLQKFGTQSTVKAAAAAMNSLVPETKTLRLAKVIPFPQQRQMQHI